MTAGARSYILVRATVRATLDERGRLLRAMDDLGMTWQQIREHVETACVAAGRQCIGELVADGMAAAERAAADRQSETAGMGLGECR